MSVQKGRLSEDEARFYAAEVVEALEYIHKLGLLHRDIKVILPIYLCVHVQFLWHTSANRYMN